MTLELSMLHLATRFFVYHETYVFLVTRFKGQKAKESEEKSGTDLLWVF
jgi:hypothetical protein